MKIKKIEFSRQFEKDLRKAPKKIKIAFKARLEIFLQDTFNPILNNHTLTGSYKDYRSINITGDLRAIYRKSSKEIMFVALDSHSNLYG